MQKNLKKRYHFLIIISIFLVTVLLSPFIENINNKINDTHFTFKEEDIINDSIIIVTIDDISFNKIKKRWPWPRKYIAKVLNNISENDPKVIGLDINLSDHGYSKEEDRALSSTLSNIPNIVLNGKFSKNSVNGYNQTYFEEPLPEFKQDHKVGFVELFSDSDGYIREMPLKTTFNGQLYFSFSYQILDAISANIPDKKSIDINYIGPSNSFKTIPFYKVLNRDYDKDIFTNKIVLIGAAFPESHDQFYTPFSHNQSMMYGIEIHANAIQTILDNRLINKIPSITIILTSFIFLIIGFFLFQKIKPLYGALVSVSFYIFITVLSKQLFKTYYVQFDVFDLIVVMFFTYINGLIFHYYFENRDKNRIRGFFSRYVSPKVVDKILDYNEEILLGGKLENVTIFFSDIRGFTSLTERLEPKDVVDMLNEYFHEMAEVIFKYDGTLNKFIGDAIMAIYGAPIKQPDSPKRAVLAALEMRDKLEELNNKRITLGKNPIKMGMGIHTGDVIIGNIGSMKQMEFTAIGDPVNVCSRIESLTKEYDTDFIISDEVFQEVKSLVEVETLKPVKVKGKSEALLVHKVLCKKGENNE